MAGNAFTFGVKPGGLTDRSQVSILLCYLIRTAAPLCRQDIENALLGEQLVNYFELAGSLADLEDQGLVTVDENGGYHITPKGISVTDELGFDLLPRSVRETAIRAVIRAQQWVRKAAAPDPGDQNRSGLCGALFHQRAGQRGVRPFLHLT